MSFVGEPDAILGLSPRTSVAEDNDNNKTEHPSQKRLAHACDHGDVVKSREVSDSLMLAAACRAMDFFAAASSVDFPASMRGLSTRLSDLRSAAAPRRLPARGGASP